MKRIFVLIGLIVLFSGCKRVTDISVKNEMIKEYQKSKSYTLVGELEINNNDDIYNYDVEVNHLKDDYYKVSLTNQSNDFKQIILKNNDGVFLYTPSLNKSFKFQSDWPYNHSQIYLLDALLNDIENDKESTFEVKNNQYTFITKVEYPNNKSLTKQKIVIDKDYHIKKIIVYNSDQQESMEFTIKSMKYNTDLNKDDFLLDNNLQDDNSVKETSVLEDVIYPLFIPSGTKLVDEEKVKKDSGERVIMTYDGEKSFLLVEETQDVFQEFTIIPTVGEPYQLMDTIGVMTDNSLTWSSGGMDYYLVSDVMSQQEMIEIAQSIALIPSMK